MNRSTIWLFALLALAGAKAEAGIVVPRSQIVTSNAGENIFSGLTVNIFLGADRFYNSGFWGWNAVVANVEAGHIWNGHETLGHVTTYVQETGPQAGPETGEFDFHATMVGAVIGGRWALPYPGDYQVGMAPDAQLWSGAIATTFEANGGFDVNSATLLTPYKRFIVNGVSGRTADVINSSWGFVDPTAATQGEYSLGIDALLSLSAKTFVTSAGNDGPGANTVGAPAAGYNVIAVASLGTDTSDPPYNSPSSFSSRGPNDTFVPFVPDGSSGKIIPASRSVVDIAAPGENLTLPFYGGSTGAYPLGEPLEGNSYYAYDMAGTSFAAPAVAGGAALIVDAGYALFGGGASIDGRVVKAVLMNSADKTAGWDNGQHAVGNVIITTQGLDFAVGAGRMNLDRAFEQYIFGTADVTGLVGGNVLASGWDFGQVGQFTTNDYYVEGNQLAGSQFTATLAWFIDRGIDLTTNTTSEQSFDDLDLQLWSVVDGSPGSLIASSESIWNNSEHLYLALPSDGEYMLRVIWASENWDLIGDANAEDYGLAWSITPVPVPEPASIVLALVGGAMLMRHSRRRARR